MTRNRSNSQPPLSSRLALADFLLSQLTGADAGESDQNEIARIVQSAAEVEEENGISRQCQSLRSWLPESSRISVDDLVRHDSDIAHITNQIGKERGGVNWKYFQYLSLLFVEIYLDRFFHDREKLRDDLNKHLCTLLKKRGDSLPEYENDDLAKLALWSATGSGKTLLMHANMMQFTTHAKRHNRLADYAERPILLAPNNSLCAQHETEMKLSGILARCFDKKRSSDLLSNVDIISIYSLREEEGDKTVAVSAFGGNNVVFVDEGHRGSSGDSWRDMRERLISRGGFSFEYSATFGQAAADKKSAQKISDQYAKTVWFDYSYRRFHADGYGKDYRIYNLRRESYNDLDHKRRYLTACLLTFYNQLRAYADNREKLKNYHIEKPLWVFVGAKVNVVRKENRRETSDVYEVLRFIDEFVNNPDRAQDDIEKLLSDGGGLQREGAGETLFQDAFLNISDRGANLFADILRLVFNASNPAKLHLRRLPQTDGEIEISIGNNQPFGVINIGDDARFIKLCKERDDQMVKDDATFSGSHFAELGREDSPLTMLVGAKKFTEGWNSWRVATMGLMNVGRGEGPEIIQLFGRGVRLKGWGKSLLRQTKAPGAPKSSDIVKLLETLNVFGLRADFMEKFRDHLRAEGASLEWKEIELPVISTPPDISNLNLKIIRAEGKTSENFHREVLVSLVAEGGGVSLDWRGQVQAEFSASVNGNDSSRDIAIKIPSGSVALLDFERIYEALQQYKIDRSRHNLIVDRKDVRTLLNDNDWYALYCPPDSISPTSIENIRRCEAIMIALLKKLANKRYLSARNKWESEARRYVNLSKNDENFIDKYWVKVDPDKDGALVEELRQFEHELKKLGDDTSEAGSNTYLGGNNSAKVQSVLFCRHLYQPLLYLSRHSGGIEVAPQSVTLNDGEKKFVSDLSDHLENSDNFKGKTLFLLRNRTKGSGVTFFADGGFSPDFIMWLVAGNTQDIVFVDPKGIHHLHSMDHAKLRFCKTIKQEEARLAEKEGAGCQTVRLHSFILSVTPYTQVDWMQQKKGGKAKLKKQNCLFMEDSDYLETLFAKISSNSG